MADGSAPAAGDNAFLALLSTVRPRVDAALAAALRGELTTHEDTGREVAALLSAAQSLCVRGGKRLRAALVFAGVEAVSADAEPLSHCALECAVAVELLQSYFLVHDDWMDQDRERRGGAAVHVMLEEVLESTHLGACGAILAGDYLVALASKLAARAAGALPTSSAAQVAEFMSAFAEMQLQAVVGQQLDIAGWTRDAEKTYRLKTSSYTVLGPLQLGALLAPRDAASTVERRDALASLERFALPIGIAFQVKDDLIGLFSTPEKTGKPFGADLGAGKWTWVVQHALEHGNKSQKRALDAVFGNSGATQAALENAVDAIDACGARAAAEVRIDRLLEQALLALDTDTIRAQGRLLLKDAAAALVRREA